jgi:hypothetical protein
LKKIAVGEVVAVRHPRPVKDDNFLSSNREEREIERRRESETKRKKRPPPLTSRQTEKNKTSREGEINCMKISRSLERKGAKKQ